MRAPFLSSPYPRQRPRVYSHAHPAVAGRAAGADTVHRAGESLGERVCRIVQREVARRTARPRDLLHVDGSKDLDRTVASAVQHSSAAQRVGLSAAGPGSHQPSAPERHDHEPSSLIRTGSTLGGGSRDGDSDHPRACGELPCAAAFFSAAIGSSPRMRGTRLRRRHPRHRHRIIPAHAGNSAIQA